MMMNLQEILDTIAEVEKDGVLLDLRLVLAAPEGTLPETIEASKKILDGLEPIDVVRLALTRHLLVYGGTLGLPEKHWLTLVAPLIEAPQEMIGLAMMAEENEKRLVTPASELQVDGIQDSMNRLRVMMGGGVKNPFGKG